MRNKFFFLLILVTSFLTAKQKAIWIPIWEITTPGKIDSVLQKIHNEKIDRILFQVRYRGDTAYFPNKFNNFFDNPEKPYHALKDTLFDPLAYAIKISRKLDIEVHAWFPTFVITGHDLNKLNSQNLYFTKPEWITTDIEGEKMDYQSFEGAFLDPGIGEVQNYVQNIILDIVSNYDVDGIHLDYIRYPDAHFGYNILARNRYILETAKPDPQNWQNWKEKQITYFVHNLKKRIKSISPMLTLSAAVISDPNKALQRYSQNWLVWLQQNMIDEIYLMEYTTSTSQMKARMELITNFEQNENIFVGLKSWSTELIYPAKKINEKIEIVSQSNFAGYALFSYTGIRKADYWLELKLK